jgi:hypothetical protein
MVYEHGKKKEVVPHKAGAGRKVKKWGWRLANIHKMTYKRNLQSPAKIDCLT